MNAIIRHADMTIEQRVQQIVAEQFCINLFEVDVSADMTTKYEMDSLDQVELVLTVEEEFDIEVPDDDMFAVKTAQQLIDLVRARVPA